MAGGALDGLRVVELGSGIATAFAARLLGDLGADVVKVEPPEGDPLRAAEPRLADGTSLLFELCNWGKRSVTGDPAALIAGADAVIAPPAALPAPPAELVARHPGLVVTTVAPFGATGPLSDWTATDLILQAAGGIMQISGTSDREPLKHGLQQTLWCGGLNAAYATIAAHLGGGGHVDLSLQEVVASELVLNEAHYAFAGAVQGRRPPVQDPLAGDPLPAADGWVSLQTSGLISADRLAALFGDERLADPRFASAESRTRHASELQAILAEHLAKEPARDFFVRASREGYLSGFVQTPADLLACPQLEARGVWHEFEDLPGIRFPARFASMSATPPRVRGRAPRVGAHTREVAWEPRPPRERRDGAGPLAGVRVVDLSTVFAVPYLGALLADLGADVIKVEPPHRLDQTRALFGHPFFENDPTGAWWDRSGPFHVVNRGKRSLTLDLSQQEGREVLHALLAESDVMLDNFTPRVLRGWGMTPDVLREAHPRLVTLSNTGYGATGPWSAFRAQGTSLEATMGVSHLTGYRDGKPSKAGQSYPDFVACWTGLVALLAALAHRERTGVGQHIDLGMYQLGVIVMPEALLHLQAHGEDLGRRGNEDLGALASGVVPVAGEDRWLAVSVGSREALAAALGADPDDDLLGAVARWAAGRDATEAAAALQAAGIPAAPVADACDLLTSEHLRARGFYEEIDCGPDCGRRPIIGRPYRMEGAAVRGAGPAFAGANDDVLRGLLGLPEERIARLRELGVIADAPTGVPTALEPIDLAVLLASRSLTRVDADYVDVLASAAPVA